MFSILYFLNYFPIKLAYVFTQEVPGTKINPQSCYSYRIYCDWLPHL